MKVPFDAKNPHPSFKLNGEKISADNIKKLVIKLLNTGSENDTTLARFIVHWTDDSSHISIQTSGTTSDTKSFYLPKTSLVNSAKATAAYFELNPGDSALCCLPFSFIAGKMMFIRAWILGLSLDIVNPCSTPLDKLDNKTYDFSAMVPLQVQKSISKINKFKTLIIGGAAVSQQLAFELKSHNTAVYETFGMTETLSHIAAKNLSLGDAFFKVLPGIEIAQDQRDCLIVSAPLLNPNKITTNDVILLTSKSTFVWLGRYDNVINSGGIKIYPEVLEKKLENQIKNRFFIASFPDDKLGQKAVLIVEGENLELNLKWDQIDPLKRPKTIYFTSKFIETSSGKIQRQKTLDSLDLNKS